MTPVCRIRRGLPAAILLAAVTAAGCSKDRSSAPYSALLVTFDTTRADALGCYGREPAVTPNLDLLAREGTLFERAYAVAPSTLPSHASMLTGLYPIRHTVRHNGLKPLPQSARTLAETAKEKGFDTAAFVGSVVLADAFGLDQGFDVYDQPKQAARAGTTHFGERPASYVIDSALAWLERRDREKPFFLWVHFFDPHAPYSPPAELRAGGTAGEHYLGEIAFADRELGRLFDALRKQDLFERTAVLAVADHGEAFGEHGESTHGTYCYEPTLRVPLVLRLPGGQRGVRARALASSVDVFPTLSEAMGLPLPPADAIDGVSLLAAPRDGGIYFESYYAWHAYGWSPIAGWLDERGKYIHSSTPELFDLASDPLEERDLAAGGDTSAHEAAIAALAARPALASGGGNGIDESLQQKIRGLGYAGVEDAKTEEPHPLAPTDRPSPAQRIQEHQRINEAMGLLNKGRHVEAGALFDLVLAADPGNREALELGSACWIEAGRYAEAIPLLERIVASGRAHAPTHYNLGVALSERGRTDEAITAYRRALELAPDEPRVIQGLAPLLRRQGRADEASALEARLRKRKGS
ncbi:MAG: sulfatase-like hydrolase/transferase [Planctomycetota bacterium]